MKQQSMLAFLADRFSVRPKETLATEGLRYLVQAYPAASKTLASLLAGEQVPHDVLDRIWFTSEVRDEADNGRIDLVGRVDGKSWIAIEGKFGAPLQPTQPVDYVNRLEAGGSLLFVCPSERVPILSIELAGRATRAQLAVTGTQWREDKTGTLWLPLTSHRRLGITSWTKLLRILRTAATPGTHKLSADIHQLEGLVTEYEQQLSTWNAEELIKGGAGITFAKALHANRVLCDIVSHQLGTKIKPSWRTTGPAAKNPSEFWDWYGGMVDIAEVPLAICFEPIHWGRDNCPSPLLLGLKVGGLPVATIELLFPAYLAMIAAADELFHEMLGTPPLEPWSSQEDNWWMVPFPLRPDRTSEEMQEEMASTTKVLLSPLLGAASGLCPTDPTVITDDPENPEDPEDDAHR